MAKRKRSQKRPKGKREKLPNRPTHTLTTMCKCKATIKFHTFWDTSVALKCPVCRKRYAIAESDRIRDARLQAVQEAKARLEEEKENEDN